MSSCSEIILAFGSNLGNRLENIRSAMQMLRRAGLEPLYKSHVFETPPWGVEDQNRFLNAAVIYAGTFGPFALLRRVKTIEKLIGRIPGERWGPRVIDIDIIAMGEMRLTTPTLTIPHPQAHKRAFVLVPLDEIAANLRHPVTGMTYHEHLLALDFKDLCGIERITTL